jgi:undecaprenyl diphosphate synthase
MLHEMRQAETLTDGNQRLTLFIAFNYGGRAEILDAAKRFQGNTEEEFRRCLYAPEMHDPDLIIRTGGEQRLSNFLLWQTADSELVIRDELWPDFTREFLIAALAEFNERQRRRTIIQNPSPKSLKQQVNGANGSAQEPDLRINSIERFDLPDISRQDISR